MLEIGQTLVKPNSQVSVIPPWDPKRSLEGVRDSKEFAYSLGLIPTAAEGVLGSHPWAQLYKGFVQKRSTTYADIAMWMKVIKHYGWPNFNIDIYPGKYSR